MLSTYLIAALSSPIAIIPPSALQWRRLKGIDFQNIHVAMTLYTFPEQCVLQLS